MNPRISINFHRPFFFFFGCGEIGMGEEGTNTLKNQKHQLERKVLKAGRDRLPPACLSSKSRSLPKGRWELQRSPTGWVFPPV